MARLNPIYQAAADLQDFCNRQGWKYCFIGGIAVQRWGEPRFTADVDVSLLTGFGSEEDYAGILLSRFTPRRPDALEFSLQTRVLLLEGDKKVGLDIAFGAMPFEENAIKRSSEYSVAPGIALNTCGAEDLVVYKAFSDRDIDWRDVQGILYRQKGKLNFNLIYKELEPLVALKENPEILVKLKQTITQAKMRLRS